MGGKLTLTAAVATSPFIGPDGDSLTDVSGFKDVLDWIAIMNYDIWGPWSPTVGPNAPLNDTCASSANQAGSAVSAVKRWTKAGIPANQIVLGVAAYGHSFKVAKSKAFKSGSTTQLAAYPAFDSSVHPVGDSWDDAAGVDVCGNAQTAGGNIDFWGMVDLGFLNSDGTPKQGIAQLFDSCSQTVSSYSLGKIGNYTMSLTKFFWQPFAYNSTSQIMVSYDNAQVSINPGFINT